LRVDREEEEEEEEERRESTYLNPQLLYALTTAKKENQPTLTPYLPFAWRDILLVEGQAKRKKGSPD
jgi:hypothetical protein